MKSKSNDFFYVLLIVLLLSIFYFQVISGKTTYIYGRDDTALISIPWMYFLKNNLKNIMNVIWSHNIFGGYPLSAEPSTGFFYPLNLIINSFLPVILAFNFSYFIHYLIAAISLFYYCRIIKISPLGSLSSSVVFLFGGYFVMIAPDAIFLKSVSLIPLLMIAAEKFIINKNRFYSRLIFILLSGIIWSFQWLSGSPQFALITMFFISIYIFFRLLNITKNFVSALKNYFFYFTSFIFGILLSAIQILPSYQLLQHSIRSEGLNISQSAIGSLNPISVISLLIPNFFQGALARVGTNIYLGIISSLSILWSLKLLKKNIFIKIFWILAFIGIFLALGSFNPLYNLLVKYPPLSFFRVPSRFLIITSFSFAVLTGFSIDHFIDKKYDDHLYRFTKKLFLFFSVVLALTQIGNLFLNKYHDYILYTAQQFIKSKIYQKGPHVFELTYYYDVVKNILDDLTRISNIMNPNIILVILTMLIFFIFLKIKKYYLGIILTVVIIFDLVSANILGSLLPPKFETKLLKKKPDTISILEADKNLYRIYSWPLYKLSDRNLLSKANDVFEITNETVQANLNIDYSIDTIDGYTGLFPFRQKKILEYLEGRYTFASEEQKISKLLKLNNILSMMNVKYILLPDNRITNINMNKINIEKKNYDLKINNNTILLLNKNSLPRIFMATNYLAVKNEDEAFRKIIGNKVNFSNTVLLEDKSQTKIKQKTNHNNGNKKIKIIEYKPNRIIANAQSDKPAILLVSNSFYPGWEAEINGNKTRIFRANYLYQAVKLKKGNNIVKISYRPRYFYWGAMISIITATTTTLLLILLLRLNSIKGNTA